MRTVVFVCTILSLIFLTACQDGSVKSSGGMLQLYLTDKPVALQEVNVTIGGIDVHSTGGAWKPFLEGTQTFNLLDLKNTEALVAMGELEDGMYTGFRLLVQEAEAVDTDGQSCTLKVPSDKIHVPVVFEIRESALTKVLLDFDAEASVHVVRTGNTIRCILRPVLTPVSVTNN
jgi:hypothetical protein